MADAVEPAVKNKTLTDNAILEKIESLDEPTKPAPEEEETKTPPETKPAEEEPKPEPGKPEETTTEEGKDDGYTIDEGETEEEVKEPETPKPATKLTPEQQYILDNLQAISVSGYVGDSKELKSFDVFSPEQLPSGFKFADERALAIANKSFALLENEALRLQQQYQQQEGEKQNKEFQDKENTADRQDIAELQKAGEIPRFKTEPDSPDFEKDPGVKLVQDVLDFKESQNKKYMDEYNAGRPYKHIGFGEAFRMYQAQNPTKANTEQTDEDKARQQFSRRTAGAGTNTAQPPVDKPRVHSGMTAMDLDALIEAKTGDW